jgi:hypothetical protein
MMMIVARGWVRSEDGREWCVVKRRADDAETHWFYYYDDPGEGRVRRVRREPDWLMAMLDFPVPPRRLEALMRKRIR